MCPECIKNELVLFEDDSAPDAFPGVSVKDVVRTRPSTYGAAYLKEDLTNVQRKLSGTTPEVRESFIADRKIMLAAGRLHARGVIKYDLIVQARRKEARAANIVVRTSRIRQRLFSLGYGDQLSMPTSELDSHKLVNKPEPLTEREWGRIRPVLEGFMTEVRKCQEVSHQEALAQQADIRIRGVQKRKYKGRKHD
ncbi:hypothetical protein C8R46DRAFT_514530 [Mycena filopes]|nr:hypothetical protein C8R46DRAFT_514530 [Mycena filopes]